MKLITVLLQDEMERKNIFITVVGDATVGKTCLIQGFIGKKYTETYIPTVLQQVIKSVDNYDLRICDTAGQEEYSRLRTLDYPKTNVFIVCFSLNSTASYENVKLVWYRELQHYKLGTPLVLVGTKLDVENRKVTSKEGTRLQKAINAAFYVECSAKKGMNINDVFDSAMKAHFSAINKKRQRRQCVLL